MESKSDQINAMPSSGALIWPLVVRLTALIHIILHGGKYSHHGTRHIVSHIWVAGEDGTHTEHAKML